MSTKQRRLWFPKEKGSEFSSATSRLSTAATMSQSVKGTGPFWEDTRTCHQRSLLSAGQTLCMFSFTPMPAVRGTDGGWNGVSPKYFCAFVSQRQWIVCPNLFQICSTFLLQIICVSEAVVRITLYFLICFNFFSCDLFLSQSQQWRTPPQPVQLISQLFFYK